MARVECPYCGKGRMVLETSADHVSQIGGVPVDVRDARRSRCTHCGRTTVSAKELKRWRRAQQAQLQARGQIPSPEDVKQVRESFGMSVSDFAALLAVTRQTVHAWERQETGGMQLGPAALLVVLLAKESAGPALGVYEHLVSAAVGRGHMRDRGERQAPGTAPVSTQSGAQPIVDALRRHPVGRPTFASQQAA